MVEQKLDANARYGKTHEWVRIEDGVAVVGISDYAQDTLSDVVYVDLPEIGAAVEAQTEAAVVESVKAAEDVFTPVSGEIIEVNSALEDTPELVNEAPYEAWFFKVQPGENLESELADLMDADAYGAFLAKSED